MNSTSVLLYVLYTLCTQPTRFVLAANNEPHWGTIERFRRSVCHCLLHTHYYRPKFNAFVWHKRTATKAEMQYMNTTEDHHLHKWNKFQVQYNYQTSDNTTRTEATTEVVSCNAMRFLMRFLMRFSRQLQRSCLYIPADHVHIVWCMPCVPNLMCYACIIRYRLRKVRQQLCVFFGYAQLDVLSVFSLRLVLVRHIISAHFKRVATKVRAAQHTQQCYVMLCSEPFPA